LPLRLRAFTRRTHYYHKLELEPKVFRRSHAALTKALQGGRQLTRDELRDALTRADVVTHGLQRMAYIMMSAEIDGIVCSGARRGKQFTYALLDERVPKATALKRDEALAELVKRYFLSHGPATLQDFVKWSGLTMSDARNGLEEVKGQFDAALVDGHTYWFAALTPFRKVKSPMVYLLPNYDEYTIGYRNHSAVFDTSHLNQLVFSHLLVVTGRIAGTWKRTLNKTSVVIQSNSFTRLTKAETRAIAVAAGQYGVFLKLPVVLA